MALMLLVRKFLLTPPVRKRNVIRNGLNILLAEWTTISVSSNLYIDDKRLSVSAHEADEEDW